VELVTIHPAMVLGPVTFPSSISIVSYVLNVAKGMFKEKGLPPMTAGMSDVRDVSLAHIAALESPAAANQRYIVALPDQYSMLDIAKSIKKQFPQLDVADYEEKPTTPVLNGIDASKAKHDLKLELTSFDKTIRDTIQSLIDAKLLNNPL
jgi:nucleoside-diphosphate-sugar epimerase